MKNICLIGLSGHALVIHDILSKGNEYFINGYFELEEKKSNPLKLEYFGKEDSIDAIEIIKENEYFISIGDNQLRQNIYTRIVASAGKEPINAIHPNAIIAKNVTLGKGVMIAAGCVINPFVTIGNGVICNTGSIIEHECKISAFVHVGPGAVLAGSVMVGSRTFIGANSIIKDEIVICNDVVVGAGSVVVKNIEESGVYVGVPARKIK